MIGFVMIWYPRCAVNPAFMLKALPID